MRKARSRMGRVCETCVLREEKRDEMERNRQRETLGVSVGGYEEKGSPW